MALDNVNQGMKNIVDLGLTGQACPISVYIKHLEGCTPPYKVLDSKNYQGVAVAQDVLNNLNGKPKVLTLQQLFDFTAWFLKKQQTEADGFMLSSEQDALVYIGHHLRFWRVVRAAALKKGRSDVAALSTQQILVLLVHSAATAMPRPIKVLSKIEETPRRGAGYFHAQAAPDTFEGKFPLLVGLVGLRSFGREARFDQGYWSGPLCEALGLMPRGNESSAILRAGLDASWGLTPRQLIVLKLIVARDVGALREAFGWISSVRTKHECLTEWRTEGMQTWLPKAPSGSTAPVNYRGVVKGTGEQRILCANNGERNSSPGDLDIGPSTTTVLGATAMTKRDDLPTTTPDGVSHVAQCPAIGGALIARFSWGPLGHRILDSTREVQGLVSAEDETQEIVPKRDVVEAKASGCLLTRLFR